MLAFHSTETANIFFDLSNGIATTYRFIAAKKTTCTASTAFTNAEIDKYAINWRFGVNLSYPWFWQNPIIRIAIGPLRKGILSAKMLFELIKSTAVKTLTYTLICVFCSSALADDLQTIRKRQAAIQKVVRKNIGAVVAVSDGIGFGSGVIISKDGLVLTAGHVMAGAGTDYTVVLPSGKEVRAKPLGKNLNVDAGMVQIEEPGEYPFVELGKYKSLKLGDWCVCLGHPGGYKLGRTAPVRAGKILELNKNDLVTDCALIGGDSGGPLFDLDGKLIGIHSSIGNHIAINRHVSVNTYKQYWDRMKRGESWGLLPSLENRSPSPKKKSARAALGITVEPSDTQAKIIRIRSGSPADRIGLAVNDIVTVFEGTKITSSKQLVELIKQKKVGDTASFSVKRKSTELHYQVILSELIR